MEERKYIPFTEEMRKDYTILVPNMLPRHFKIFLKIFKKLLTFYSGWSRITHVLRMRHPKENKISAFSSVGRAVDS